MAGNNGGPWGGGGNDGGDDEDRFRPNGNGDRNGGRRPSKEPQIPEFDEIINKTKDQLRDLLGGGGGNRGGSGRSGGTGGPAVSRGMIGLGVLAAVALWGFNSFYRVLPEQQSVELFLGECNEPCIGTDGLNFAPWPLVTYEIVQVTQERVISIGDDPVPSEISDSPAVLRALEGDTGLMLTGDENIVDIDFQVVWKITRADQFLFNLAEPEETIAAVSESVMREIIAQSEFANLNQERNVIQQRLRDLTQSTLDSYNSGVNIVRVNIGSVDPPATSVEVAIVGSDAIARTSPLAAYREVQDAEQERILLQNQADAYANRETARARGQAEQIRQDAEGYRAEVVNIAEGEAARFVSVLEEYRNAPEVTRNRLYLEMAEDVFDQANIIMLDESAGGDQGVVPYLPLDQLRPSNSGGSN